MSHFIKFMFKQVRQTQNTGQVRIMLENDQYHKTEQMDYNKQMEGKQI